MYILYGPDKVHIGSQGPYGEKGLARVSRKKLVFLLSMLFSLSRAIQLYVELCAMGAIGVHTNLKLDYKNIALASAFHIVDVWNIQGMTRPWGCKCMLNYSANPLGAIRSCISWNLFGQTCKDGSNSNPPTGKA